MSKYPTLSDRISVLLTALGLGSRCAGVVYWSICILMQCQTPVTAGDEYSFDASEFNPTSFKDTDFDKKDYTEMKSRASQTVKAFRLAPENRGARKRSNYDITVGGFSAEERLAAGERAAFEDVFGPVHELTGDWVPGKIDLTSNGGFSIEPFNGSPVPYDLNGHVDPQRGKP